MAEHHFREIKGQLFRPKQLYLFEKRFLTDDLCIHHPTRGDSRFYRDCPGQNYTGLSGRYPVRKTSFPCPKEIYKEWLARLTSIVGLGVSEKNVISKYVGCLNIFNHHLFKEFVAEDVDDSFHHIFSEFEFNRLFGVLVRPVDAGSHNDVDYIVL